MSLSPFDFDEYKPFLKSVVTRGGRGLVSRMSEAAGCQRTYLSNVLHTHIHLSTDHAYGISRFLNLDEAETDCFVLLVELERAASLPYRNHLMEKLKRLKNERENLATRLARKPLQNESDQLVYYSAWYFAAIHILVSIPRFQELSAICKALSLPEATVSHALVNLKRMGLIKNSGSRWVFASGDIHVPSDSPFVSLHHNHWRQMAVLRSQSRSKGIHFTMVQSVSKQVARDLKSKILKLIDEANATAGPSEPEELISFSIDYFSLTEQNTHL